MLGEGLVLRSVGGFAEDEVSSGSVERLERGDAMHGSLVRSALQRIVG